MDRVTELTASSDAYTDSPGDAATPPSINVTVTLPPTAQLPDEQPPRVRQPQTISPVKFTAHQL